VEPTCAVVAPTPRAIARMLRNPPVLILDDATSALDNHTERRRPTSTGFGGPHDDHHRAPVVHCGAC
jgi:hypothetical protein